MANTATIFGAILGGLILVDYGVKNFSAAFKSNGNSNSNSSTVTGSGQTYGQVTYADVAAIGHAKGWSDREIQDWFYRLIPSESNGTITDRNSVSGAYGIAQGITGPSWYKAHGGDPNTVHGQLLAMANYIAERYGNPTIAWQFHQTHNWY